MRLPAASAIGLANDAKIPAESANRGRRMREFGEEDMLVELFASSARLNTRGVASRIERVVLSESSILAF